MESPSHYEAPAVPLNISALMESVVQLSQIAALSSVQLSPNLVCDDYTYDTVNVFPVCHVSPDTAEYLPATSPVTPPVTGSLPTSLIPRGRTLCYREQLGRSTVSSDVTYPFYRTGNRFVVIIVFHFRMTCSFCQHWHRCRHRRRLCVSHRESRMHQLCLL